MMDTLVRISTTQRRFAPTVSAIVGITVRNHRNTQTRAAVVMGAQLEQAGMEADLIAVAFEDGAA